MTKPDRGPVADVLRVLRATRPDATQEVLAVAARRSPGLIGQIETGDKNISQSVLEDVAAVLGLSRSERQELEEARARYPIWRAQQRTGVPSEAQELLPAFYKNQALERRRAAFDTLTAWSTRQLTALGRQGRILTEDDRDEVVALASRLAGRRRFEARQRKAGAPVEDILEAAEGGPTISQTGTRRGTPNPAVGAVEDPDVDEPHGDD